MRKRIESDSISNSVKFVGHRKIDFAISEILALSIAVIICPVSGTRVTTAQMRFLVLWISLFSIAVLSQLHRLFSASTP
jgi:hypothetical protein